MPSSVRDLPSGMTGKVGLTGVTLVALCLAASTVAAQDPAVVGQWSFHGSVPSTPIHMHLLPTGKVLFQQGAERDEPTLVDPATQTATPLPKTGYDAFCSGHSFLADGRLFVAGGHIEMDVGLPSARIYNPFTNVWTLLPDMNAGRWYPTTTTLANGDVLVVSGEISPTAGVNPLPQVFDIATGQWRNLTSAQLALPLYPRMHLLPNGTVFNAAPSRETRYLNTSGTGGWTQVATSKFGGRDYGSSVMYDNGKVLIMGGGDPPTNTAEVIDLNLATPAWRSVASMASARRQLNATLLPDGKVLVTGGSSGSGFSNGNSPVYAAEVWDPGTERWTILASAKVPRLYHSVAMLLPDGRVLSGGGNGSTQLEVYAPPYLFGGARPSITSAPTSVTFGQTFFVETLEAASIRQVTWLALPSVTHAFDSNQRFNRLGFSVGDQGGVAGLNVVAPSSATAPPGYYMLFILNNSGVPSVANIVRLEGAPPLPPELTSLAPSSATAGGPAFNLVVTGNNFVAGSTVQWNDAPRQTTVGSLTQMTAQILPGDIAEAGTAQVRIVSPAGTSNTLPFTITSDTTAPKISAVLASNISSSGATITWITDEASDSQVEWGFAATSSYDNATPVDPRLLTSHSQALTGLSANTSYRYRVKSRDKAGNLAEAEGFTFTTSPVPPPLVSIATDGFESRTYTGGTGWAGAWTRSGEISLRTNQDGPHGGTTHVRLRQRTGYLRRTVNLTGATNVRLKFWAKVDSFEGSDRALVRVSPDGVNFTTVKTFTANDSNNTYRYYDLDLAVFAMTGTFSIVFDAEMNSTSDRWFIDDIEITGVR